MTTWREKGLRLWRGQRIRPTLIPLKIFGMLSAMLYLHVFHFQLLLLKLKTALKEEWRLLNFAVVDHLTESMITTCKLFMQVRGITYPINIFFSFYAIYFHFKHNSV